MKLTDTPIFENLCKLRRMIYDAHRYMTNADRQRFMDELLHLSGRCIECFAEAYDFPDSRYERYVDDMYFVSRSKDVLLLVPEIRRILARVGARLNEHKFYFQHYSKGVECLGTHIKMDRIYINNRPVRQAKRKVAEWNGRASERNVIRFISCINSYLGLCKTYNGYSKAWEIVRTIDGRWFRYIHFDRTRCCLVPNEGYRQRDIIANRYCITKSCKNEKRRKRRSHPSAHRADDGTAEPHEAQRRTRQQVH